MDDPAPVTPGGLAARSLTYTAEPQSVASEALARSRTQPAPAAAWPVLALRIGGQFLRRWIGPAVIALIMLEWLIRTFVYSPIPVVYDSVLGWKPAPGVTLVDGSEGFGRTHLNRQGVRGRDLPAASQGNVRRIVSLGDSFTEAAQVDDNETYCAKLEAKLARRLHEDVWIGNCGQNGFLAADYLCYLPLYQQRLHPELVVIACSPWDFRLSRHNDLDGVIARFDPSPGAQTGVICRTPNGPGSVPRALRALLGCSSLVRYAYIRFRSPRDTARRREESLGEKSPKIATAGQMEQYFRALVARAQTPVVITYINPYSPLIPDDHHVEEQRIREAASRLDVPFISTTPAFRRSFLRTGQLASGFQWSKTGPGTGHLNPLGHTIVAETLASPLAGLLADPARLRSLRRAQAAAQTAGAATALALLRRESGPEPGVRTPLCTRRNHHLLRGYPPRVGAQPLLQRPAGASNATSRRGDIP